MKTLLIFVLCLLSLAAQAATPSTKSFRGTGGIVVTSNDVTALITIDGSSTTGGVTSAQATNIAVAAASDRQIGRATLTNLAAMYTNTVLLNAASNISLTLSNAVNNTRYLLACDTYFVTPHIAASNGLSAIMLIGKTNVVIDGGDALCTIIRGTGTSLGDYIYITNCNNVTIRNITVQGNMLTNWWTFGTPYGLRAINICNSANLLIEKCRIVDHFNQGICDGANGVVLSTNNITIRNNYFDNIGQWRTNFPGAGQVSIDGTACDPTGWLVENNYFVNCMRAIEPYADVSIGNVVFKNCVIRGNVIRNCLENAITTAGSTNGHNILVEDNHISWDQGYSRAGSNAIAGANGININGGQRHIIRGNTIINAPNRGIEYITDAQTFGVTIENNVISGEYRPTISGYGIGVTRSSGSTRSFREWIIRNNSIEGVRFAGIGVDYMADSKIENNRIVNCGTNGGYFAMNIYGVSNLVISGNSIINDGLAGAATAQGIYLYSTVLDVVLSDNRISGIATPILVEAGAGVKFVQQLDYSTGNMRNDDTNVFTALRLAGQGTNKLLQISANSNVTAVTIGSGLTMTAGTLASSGGGVTNLDGLYDVHIGSNLGPNDFLAYQIGLNVWTNHTAYWSLSYNITFTNIFVGSNFEQSVTIATNASFKLVYTGTPLNGEVVNLSVSNYSASVIYMTNAAYDVQYASNVTAFAISANSIRQFAFRSYTNFNAGVARWELKETLEKESELAVAGSGSVLITNAAGSIITLSNTGNYLNLTVTNTIGFVTALLPGTGGALTNVTLLASHGQCYVNGGTNVSIRAMMGGVAGIVTFPYYVITNLSGSDRTLEFSAVTNRWKPSFQQGNVLPSVLTNGTALHLSMHADGTNVAVSYSYTSWP